MGKVPKSVRLPPGDVERVEQFMDDVGMDEADALRQLINDGLRANGYRRAVTDGGRGRVSRGLEGAFDGLLYTAMLGLLLAIAAFMNVTPNNTPSLEIGLYLAAAGLVGAAGLGIVLATSIPRQLDDAAARHAQTVLGSKHTRP